ncbi:6,7-dimethyl-8-ribityllumazine synthase [Limoniibacter endophyticus]|uniref:6,7-dimethyl-8-ribityllumazine synthase n=1 Tax=Limoniibacter endophyticus TaxID=1565040 RepID=A0A8J3DG05_9HYPH|nr:6,7-dimethyl-8-ribityllumazine synthase [Limoniibacter endophyticus]GHC63078.1 6,7-dimethyl-8-ribityllumazine synthase [Limoniibacter endophyticus]
MNQLTPAKTFEAANGTKRIAFIQASWHEDILDPCWQAFSADITAQGKIAVDFYKVPGAYEIPLFAKRLALTGNYEAIAASAFVVDGGIYRHDFVATAVIDGMMRVQLETDVPVLSAVLTPHHFHEHETHRTFFTVHMKEKGHELAKAAIWAVSSAVKA